MKTTILLLTILFTTQPHSYAQPTTENKKEISILINKYSQSVIKKDSVAFYDLFNDGPVTWCAAIKDRSQAKETARNGPGSNYFSGTYKGFLRSLFRYGSTEDKFDNIQIVEDGTVASVTMDYSFWADKKMTNWGSKYLGLIKKDGKWTITSVIYSLELSDYFAQPSLQERKKTSYLR